MKRARVRVQSSTSRTSFTAEETAAMDAGLFAGRYRIQRELSQGGMGKVFLAEQVALGRTCVVKVPKVKVENGEESNLLARFQRESALLARIQHPHVVTVYDHGVDANGTCFLVMEHLQGRTLEDLIRDVGWLTTDRAVGIALQIASALREAHRQGILHRDLKPSNVFVSIDDEGGDFVKVLDFGLARQIEGEAGREITQRGALVCTPWYSAPEQINGEALSPATDVYALGVLMFEMLTGTVPFNDITAIDAIRSHLTKAVPSFTEVNPEVRGGSAMEALVRRCLEKDRALRPATMAEVSAALASLVSPIASVAVMNLAASEAPPPMGLPVTREALAPVAMPAMPAMPAIPATPAAPPAVAPPASEPPLPVAALRSAEMPLEGPSIAPRAFTLLPAAPSQGLTRWAVIGSLVAGIALALGQIPARTATPRPMASQPVMESPVGPIAPPRTESAVALRDGSTDVTDAPAGSVIHEQRAARRCATGVVGASHTRAATGAFGFRRGTATRTERRSVAREAVVALWRQ